MNLSHSGVMKAESKIFEMMHALVVDDEPAHREVLTYFLEDMGCQVTQTANGLQSLRAILNSRFDFIVMDWRMPEWNAAQTLQRCDTMVHKMEPEADSIPVLIYSGQALDLMNLPVCKHFQVRSYVSKKATPFQQQRLLRQFIEEIKRGAM